MDARLPLATPPFTTSRRRFLGGVASALAVPALPLPAAAQGSLLRERITEAARGLSPLRSVIVARNGAVAFANTFRGPGLERGANVKSVSKSVISALVGAAIDKRVIEGVDQPIAPVFARELPERPDPRMASVTVGNLLSMQAGLEPTSGPNYGRWVSSRDWVRTALAQPFVADPGGRMLYSTGNTHLLSAMLTRLSGRSTLALAREWLGRPLDIAVAPWPADPRGIYFGGNDMLLSPRAMLAFGEMYRNAGRNAAGAAVLPAAWIEQSWRERTRSPWTGDRYGYCWFTRGSEERPVRYAWGYGGQMIYVVPHAGVTAVMTSDTTGPSARNGYVRQLHALLEGVILPTFADEPVSPLPSLEAPT